MADTHMTDANAPEETEIEVITAEETTQEFDIGEARKVRAARGCSSLRTFL